MQTQKVTSYCNRYKILKPNHTIQLLRKNLQLTNQDAYELAITSDFAVRRYHRYCQNIENILPLAQWRLQAQQQIVHCYYVQLGKPNLKTKCISFQMYTEHIQLLIRDANKLITAESLFILVGSLRGYGKLLKKFEKISINPQTFGLNIQGQPITWINRELDLMIPQKECLNDENEILKRLIDIIREKSEFASQKILNKLMQYSIRNNCKINEMLVYIDNFITANQIKLPLNLKYLVNRNKILSDLKAIQNSNNFTKTVKTNKTFKIPLQFSKKNRSKQNNCLSKSKYTTTRTSNSIKFRMNTEMNESRLNFSKPKRFTSRLSSKCSESSHSFVKKQFKNTYDYLNQKSLEKSSNSDANSRRNSFDTTNIRIINKLANLGSNLSIDHNCPFSQRDVKYNHLSTSQAPTTSSLLEPDRRLTHNSSLGRLSSKSKTVYKSFINKLQNSLNKQVYEDQKESCQSSPQKDKTSNSKIIKKQPSKELEMSFGISAQKKNQMLLKGNNWIKTLDGLLSIETKLNNSIVQGTQKNDYLADVKLQMLDQLNFQMTQSLMPSTQLTLGQVPSLGMP